MDRHKPAAPVTTHLLLAWAMWVVVGVGLIGLGVRWVWESAQVGAPWIAMAAVAVGAMKSWLVLDPAGSGVIERIRERGDGRCLGGFLSWRTWGLVVLMVVAGRVLRGTLAHGFVGPIYVAVGSAMIISSRLAWRAWREARNLS